MEKSTAVLLSASGEDRPGIVAAVTRVLFENGANLEDSAMTRLEGAFAMLVVASVPDAGLEKLRQAFIRLGEESGLSIQVKTMSAAESQHPVPSGEPFIISLYGGDRPGLVYRVATLLSEMSVNITDVVTHRSSGDSPLYQLAIEVELPAAVAGADLERRLAALGRELGVEISSHPLEMVEL